MLIHPSTTDLAQRLAELLKSKLSDLAEEDFPSGSAASRVMDNLVSAVSRLQVENEMLKEELQAIKTAQVARQEQAVGEETESTQSSSLVKTISFHRVVCSCGREHTMTNYLDPPRLFKGDTENDHFRGTNEVRRAEEYLGIYPEISFAELTIYQCTRYSIQSIFTKEGQPGPRGRVLVEDYYHKNGSSRDIMVGGVAQNGLMDIIKAFPDRFYGFEDPPQFFKLKPHFLANLRFHLFKRPFTLFYLYGNTILESLEDFDSDDLTRESLRLLCQWMEDNAREDWDEAEALFAQGKVSAKHFMTLFRPGELIVRHDPGDDRSALTGAIVPWLTSDVGDVALQLLHLEFNGTIWYSKSTTTAQHAFPVLGSDNVSIDITSLELYPLRFASRDVKAKLVARGQRFWACRRQKLVCYNEDIADGIFHVRPSLVPSRDILLTSSRLKGDS